MGGVTYYLWFLLESLESWKAGKPESQKVGKPESKKQRGKRKKKGCRFKYSIIL